MATDARALLGKTLSIAADYLEALPERHAGATASAETLQAGLDGDLPEAPCEAAQVIAELARAIDGGLVASAGPRYFGFVIGGAHPVALAADWLVSTWDQNAQAFASSPAAAVVEAVAARWLLELFDLPRSAGVGFVTGAQMASFTGLAAARHSLLARAGWDLRARGLAGSPPIAVLIGEAAHVTVRSALYLLGFGEESFTVIPADAQGRMEVTAFARALDAAGARPVIACAQAGNVNSGATDDLAAITALVRARPGTWLHVDGAFGLWACVDAQLRPRGVERADSWAVDAHKWLNVPYDSGIAIVADADAHRAAMDARCGYAGEEVAGRRDGMAWVPENSRRARAIPIYATLRALGRSGVRALVARCCAHARLFAELLAEHPAVEVMNEVVLNQVLLRVRDRDVQAVAARVQDGGECWLGTTTWRGELILRASISNWSSTEADIRRSAQAVSEAIA